ncbi:hypothetical protein V5O48_017023 [Marasmius crinis-equi]|uniref:Gag protein n=1 Tax=Marasmius crinis-equi TaxID=585013 RepID=A0ABR3EQ45_9AGAR
MARQPREGSEEFDQRQKAYQRVITPRDSSLAQKATNPPAQTFASALRIRGMIQLLRVFDARDGTSSNIPDQHVRLWQDKDDGTVVANDPKYPGDQVNLPDYPHEEYDRIHLQYQERWNEANRNNQQQPQNQQRVSFHQPNVTPPLAQSSPILTRNAQKEYHTPSGNPGRPPDGVNPHGNGGGGGNPYGGGGGPFGGGRPPVGGPGPYGNGGGGGGNGGGGGGGGGPPNGNPGGGGGPPQGNGNDPGPSGNGGGRGGSGGPPQGPPGGPPGGDPNGGGGSQSGSSAGGRGPNRNPNRNPFRDPWDQAHGQREATPFGTIPWDIETRTTETFEYIMPDYGYTDLHLRERVFKTMATYIAFKLYSKQPIAGDVRNISKMLTNAMPTLEPYKGQRSVIILETFLKVFVRQCVALGLTGPPRLQNDNGNWIVTAEDSLRSTLLGGVLEESASDWYETTVERVPPEFHMGMDANEHKRSFMEIFRGLFDRFITNSALYDLAKVWQRISYHVRGGIRKLFADLLVCAERMPSPPTEYSFKVALVRRMPRALMIEVTTDGITAETSTVDEIMQKAIAVETGMEATAFYSTMAVGAGPVPKMRQNVGPVRHQVEDHVKMREVEQGRQQKWNSGFQKRMDDRWNSTKKEERSGNQPMNNQQTNDRPSNAPKKNL